MSTEISRKVCQAWIRKSFPRTGRCETCGMERHTQYAFLGAPGGYARDRAMYVEECAPCEAKREQAAAA